MQAVLADFASEVDPEASSLKKNELVSVLLRKRRQVLTEVDLGPNELQGNVVSMGNGTSWPFFATVEEFHRRTIEQEARAHSSEATPDDSHEFLQMSQTAPPRAPAWDNAAAATDADSPGALLSDHQLDGGYAADSIADAMDRIGEDAGEREVRSYMAAYMSDDEGLGDLRRDSEYDSGGDGDNDDGLSPRRFADFFDADWSADIEEVDFDEFVRRIEQDTPDAGSEGHPGADARSAGGGISGFLVGMPPGEAPAGGSIRPPAGDSEAASDGERTGDFRKGLDVAAATSPCVDDRQRTARGGAEVSASIDADGLMDPWCGRRPL